MSTARIKIPTEIIIILAVLAVNGFVIFTPVDSLMNWYSSDDAFYYFKVAQNISEGRGVTFDGIGRANGFHPLWMLICIPVFFVARYDLILPLRILALITILLHAGTGILFFRLLKQAVSQTAAILASAVWLFNLSIHHTTVQLGMESSVSAFFTLLLLLQLAHAEQQQNWSRNQLLKLGLMAALVLFSRLDNIFLIFMVGLWIILRNSPMRSLLAFDMLLAAIGALCSFYSMVGFYESLHPYMAAAQTTALLSLVIRPLTYYLFGLYGAPTERHAGKDWWLVIKAGAAASLLVTGAALAANWLGMLPLLPRSALLVEAIIGTALTLSIRFAHAQLSGSRRLLPDGNGCPVLENLKSNFSQWLKDGTWYALPATGMLVLYMAWNKHYFGTFMPVSGQIKHWWGSIYTAYGRPVISLAEFFGFPQDLRHSPWALMLSLPDGLTRLVHPLLSGAGLSDRNTQFTVVLVFVLVLAVGILASRWQATRAAVLKLGILPLAAACLAQVIYYNGSNYVGLRHWYWTNQLVLTVMLAAIFMDHILIWLQRAKIPLAAIDFLAGALCMLLAINCAQALHTMLPLRLQPGGENTYLADIRALEGVTEPGALIGSTGGGVTAYFIRGRTVVNLDGLMNTPEYFELMQIRRAHEILNRIGLDYVHSNPYIVTSSEPFNWIFSERTEVIGEVGDGTLFRYIPIP